MINPDMKPEYTIITNECGDWESVIIGDCVKSVDKESFKGCVSLKSVTLPDSLEEIKESAFEGCARLESISFPKSLKSIYQYAFKGCRNLKHINFPESLERIGASAFENCSFLERVTIPDSTSINVGVNSFENCNIESMTNPLNLNPMEGYEDKTFIHADFEYGWRRPDSSDWGIDDNSLLSFIGWNSIREDSSGFVISNGVLLGGGGTKVPNGVKVIAKWALANSDLQNIFLPDSLLSIESCAFYSSRELKEIVIPNSVKYIGNNAFSCCCSLRKVKLPSSLETIEYETFSGCALLSIVVPNSVKRIGRRAFDGKIFSLGEGKLLEYDADNSYWLVKEYHASEFGKKK